MRNAFLFISTKHTNARASSRKGFQFPNPSVQHRRRGARGARRRCARGRGNSRRRRARRRRRDGVRDARVHHERVGCRRGEGKVVVLPATASQWGSGAVGWKGGRGRTYKR